MNKSVAIVGMVMTLVGCTAAKIETSIPTAPKINNSEIVSVPYDTVWQRVVDWTIVEHPGLEVTRIQKDSGLVTFNYQVVKNDPYLLCPTTRATFDTIADIPQGEMHERSEARVNILVTKVGKSKTKVKVITFGQYQMHAWDDVSVKAFDDNGKCYSTGV